MAEWRVIGIGIGSSKPTADTALVTRLHVQKGQNPDFVFRML
jgi:hypothetical protein